MKSPNRYGAQACSGLSWRFSPADWVARRRGKRTPELPGPDGATVLTAPHGMSTADLQSTVWVGRTECRTPCFTDSRRFGERRRQPIRRSCDTLVGVRFGCARTATNRAFDALKRGADPSTSNPAPRSQPADFPLAASRPDGVISA
jgi:hypothetical protein